MIQPYSYVKRDRHNLHSFQDHNNTTTTIQIRPKYIYQQTRFKLLSPFAMKTPFYYKQALYFPINKRHSFGIEADLWKRKEGNLRTFGLAYQYTNIHDSKLIVKGFFGSFQNCSMEYHKKLDKEKIISLYLSSSVLMKTFYNNIGIGYKNGRFQAIATQKLGFGSILKAIYEYPLYNGMKLKLEAVGTFLPQKSDKVIQAEASLNYRINKVKGSLILNVSQPNSLRVQFETRTSIGKIFICNQYVDNQNIIFLGLKRHNCKLAVPVAASNSIAVTVMFGIAYLIGFFLRKNTKEVQSTKSEQKRIQQLRLIENKAATYYKWQKGHRGLKIQSAFYGDRSIINEIYEAFKNNKMDTQRQGSLQNIIDVTVPMRYYTHKGRLQLRKTTKSQLLGFCDVDSQYPQLIIIYQKQDSGKQQAKVFGDLEYVQI